MANIQKITGKRGSSYRVQFMKNGRRIGQTFKTKKAAEAFMAQLIVYDDMADALTHSSLSTILIDSAITAFLDQYKGRDRSIIQRLGWWAERLKGKPVGKVSRQHIKSALEALQKDEKSPSTLNRYKAAFLPYSNGSTTSTTLSTTPPVKFARRLRTMNTPASYLMMSCPAC